MQPSRRQKQRRAADALALGCRAKVFMKPKCGLFVLLFLSLQRPAHVEAICIPDPVRVKHVRGKVYFASGENRRCLEDAVVEIIDRASSATSDANCNFDFTGIKPGRYLLRGRPPAALVLET